MVAIATIVGLASSAATALVLVLPGSVVVWTVAVILVVGSWCGDATRASSGGHHHRHRAAVASIVAATRVFPAFSALSVGLNLEVPADVAYGEVLP